MATDRNFRRLFSAILLQAYKDLEAGGKSAQAAREWLAGSDAQYMAGLVGLERWRPCDQVVPLKEARKLNAGPVLQDYYSTY